ncbi:SIMPL domain-containing protein [Ornithinibacillus sp. FSL M8-0202]|uniref:SIMPL domain-containing protein n=1 Tax=Ornithinibacillus sp. FSL M8-0202 TaxID=2921616 RepID=UPI0030D21A5C
MYYHTNYQNRGTIPTRQTENKVKVVGEGSVFATPDHATILLGVITEDEQLQEAQQANAQRTTNVINALVNAGISRDNIQTSDFRVDIQYDYQDGTQLFRGYRVSNLLTIKIEHIERVGELVDIAMENGANTVRNIALRVGNEQRYYQQALANAIRNAQEKAATIAETLGVAIPQTPTQLKELTSQAPETPRPYVLGVATDSAVTTPIEAGQNQITAFVEATFHY